MEAMPEFYERRARDLAKVLEVPLEGDGRKLLEASIEAIKGLRSRSGLPDTFKEFHIPNSELDAAVMAVMKDPSGVLFPIPEEAIRNIVSSVIG
jgi:alcohol dehydrogenase class IV